LSSPSDDAPGSSIAGLPARASSKAIVGNLFGLIGRAALGWRARRVEQAAFLGRLFLSGLWGLGGDAARRRLMRSLILSQVWEVFASCCPLLIIFGLLMGILWTVIWFGVLANIAGAEVLASLLITVHLLEISPILAALVTTIAYGGPMTLELCLMKSAGDLDTLLSMGVPPEHVLAWPRLLAVILAFPGLLLVMSLSTWIGAYWGIVRAIDLPLSEFASALYLSVDGFKILMLGVKCLLTSVCLGFFQICPAWRLEDFRQTPRLVRRGMTEAFVFGTMAGALVTVLYG
jgi:ABC-type transporter Mla maintaining outer membrane lipid asymmetry permease subunit MlaE